MESRRDEVGAGGRWRERERRRERESERDGNREKRWQISPTCELNYFSRPPLPRFHRLERSRTWSVSFCHFASTPGSWRVGARMPWGTGRGGIRGNLLLLLPLVLLLQGRVSHNSVAMAYWQRRWTAMFAGLVYWLILLAHHHPPASSPPTTPGYGRGTTTQPPGSLV